MINSKIDLSFFMEPPELKYSAQLFIEVLAPVSMVSSQPGYYFRSELEPTQEMLLGLLENALGWHFYEKFRSELFKNLARQAKKINKKNEKYEGHAWLSGKPETSGSGFASLLQYHLSLQLEKSPTSFLTYDDLWSMANRTDSENFIGGSRHYDYKLEDLINLSRREDPSKPVSSRTKKHPSFISFGDRKEYKTYSLEELRNLKEGEVKTTSLKPYFPMYYSSPKNRGYVIPTTPFVYQVNCTEKLRTLLENAINNPVAPLYLGTNDGWVHLNWKAHE